MKTEDPGPVPVPIPEQAVGRVGMLVTLQRVQGLPPGRLAIVRFPVGWVKELFDAPRSVFAWQVFLTGEPVQVHGRETQELIVADGCLRPVSQLEQEDLAGMVKQHERESLEAAVAQVQAWVRPEDMDSPAFDRMLTLACGEAFLQHAKQVVGVAQVLQEIGFWQVNGPNSEAFEWRTAFEGTEMKMTAAPGMFRDWRLSAYAIKARSWHMPEALALNDWPRGKILQVVLELWESVYGRRQVPQSLELGWLYRQHLKDMQAMQPVLPHVVLRGESFRRALRWLREAYGQEQDEMGPPRDIALKVEIREGLLRLTTSDHSIGVTMQSGWVDPMTLSLRTLLALPPSVVGRSLVRMDWTGEHALIRGYAVGRSEHRAAMPGID